MLFILLYVDTSVLRSCPCHLATQDGNTNVQAAAKPLLLEPVEQETHLCCIQLKTEREQS